MIEQGSRLPAWCFATLFAVVAAGNLAFVHTADKPMTTLLAAVACAGVAALFGLSQPEDPFA